MYHAYYPEVGLFLLLPRAAYNSLCLFLLTYWLLAVMKVVATAWNFLPIVNILITWMNAVTRMQWQVFPFSPHGRSCHDNNVSPVQRIRDMSSQRKFIPTQVHPSTGSSQSLFSVSSQLKHCTYTFTPIPFHPDWNTVGLLKWSKE